MAELTLVRSTDKGTGVTVTFTPDTGGEDAATGIVNISSETPDAKNALTMDLTFIAGTVAGTQVATLILTEDQALSLETVDNQDANFLVEVFDASGDNLKTFNEQLDVRVNEPPELHINEINAQDEYLIITAEHTNRTGYAGVLDSSASSFRIMYSTSGAAGYVETETDGVDTTMDASGIYVVTTLAGVLQNNTEYDIYLQGKSRAEFGSNRTILTGVAGVKTVPNNRPSNVTNLEISTNLTADGVLDADNLCILSGEWNPIGTYGSMSYTYGRCNSDGNAFLVDTSDNYSFTVDVSGAPADDSNNAFEGLDISADWFNRTGFESTAILIGMQVKQDNTTLSDPSGGEIRLSEIASIVAFNPELPAVTLNDLPSVNLSNGIQTFSMTASGKNILLNEHVLSEEGNPAGPLTAQYLNRKDDNSTWETFDLSGSSPEGDATAATFTGEFDLSFADIVKDASLNIRVLQDDPNDSSVPRTVRTVVAENTFYLLPYKTPEPADLILTAGGAVDTVPTVTQAASETYGYTAVDGSLNVYNGADSDLVYSNTISPVDLSGDGVDAVANVSDAAYVPGLNCKSTYYNNFIMDVSGITQYNAIDPVTIVTDSSSSTVLYYSNPTITSVSTNGGTMTIAGSTNGAHFETNAVTGFVMNNMGTDASGGVAGASNVSFQQKTANMSTIDASNQMLGDYNYSVDITFSAIDDSADGIFVGLAHVDAENANSALSLLTPEPVYIWTASGVVAPGTGLQSSNPASEGEVEDGVIWETYYSNVPYATWVQNQVTAGYLVIQ